MTGILFALLFSWNLLNAPATGCEDKKLPRFEDYASAESFGGKTHLPVLATPLDRKYKTTIREAAAAGADFAGHFAIASWGCGTGCLEFVIVDLKTGTVYDPSFSGVGFHYQSADFGPTPEWQCYADFLTYRRNSRLLIVEGCFLRGSRCGRTFFVMEGGGLHKFPLIQTGFRTGVSLPSRIP
jgi:hypothetical protein